MKRLLVNTKILMRRLAQAVGFVVGLSLVSVAQSSPQVHLNAEGLAPRPIEELTGTTIVHHYAQAWSDMAAALESSRPGTISDEFVGQAKDRLKQRIAEQAKAGVHVHIIDHGHQLKALFYSTDGAAMQLIDQAQLEIQTFDGSKLLHTDNSLHKYMVLMTPGADRWYVRDLQEISEKDF
ncbi:MAG TPA: hypothetical protein VGG04_15720 [Candidatus Sulfotelmatobacter sp.]|jgi:hypothetical protein